MAQEWHAPGAQPPPSAPTLSQAPVQAAAPETSLLTPATAVQTFRGAVGATSNAVMAPPAPGTSLLPSPAAAVQTSPGAVGATSNTVIAPPELELTPELPNLPRPPGALIQLPNPLGGATPRPELPFGLPDLSPPYQPYSPPLDSGSVQPFAGWDNGFYFRSADRQFILRITGQLQADFRGYTDENAPRDVDEFLIRRARLGLEATMFQYYEFRLLPDFGNNQTQLEDAYMNVHYVDYFQITAGKFKQPFSYEQLIQDRFTPLMERSLIDQLVPQRDVGVMVHGENVLHGFLDYALSVSNGEQNGNVDTNSSKDMNARLAIRPFQDGPDEIKRLQFGVSGGFGVETESMAPASLFTPANITFLQFKSTAYANGVRARWSPEVAYFYGPFGFASQYFQMDQVIQEHSGAAPSTHVPFQGYYAMASYLLTGEERTGYSTQQLVPLHPYDPYKGLSSLGAWELTGRLSRIQVGYDAIAPGPTQIVTPAGNSTGATEMTLGYNWYLNAWVRVQTNYEHAWFDQPVQLGEPGPAGLHTHTDTISVRFQVVF